MCYKENHLHALANRQEACLRRVVTEGLSKELGFKGVGFARRWRRAFREANTRHRRPGAGRSLRFLGTWKECVSDWGSAKGDEVTQDKTQRAGPEPTGGF